MEGPVPPAQKLAMELPEAVSMYVAGALFTVTFFVV